MSLPGVQRRQVRLVRPTLVHESQTASQSFSQISTWCVARRQPSLSGQQPKSQSSALPPPDHTPIPQDLDRPSPSADNTAESSLAPTPLSPETRPSQKPGQTADDLLANLLGASRSPQPPPPSIPAKSPAPLPASPPLQAPLPPDSHDLGHTRVHTFGPPSLMQPQAGPSASPLPPGSFPQASSTPVRPVVPSPLNLPRLMADMMAISRPPIPAKEQLMDELGRLLNDATFLLHVRPRHRLRPGANLQNDEGFRHELWRSYCLSRYSR